MERYCKEELIFYTGDQSAKRTLWVLVITLVVMLVEVAAGVMYNSVALLSDGVHMGTHAVAFGIGYLSYYLAKKWAHDKRFSFGVWKVEVLGAYTSAVILGVMALLVLQEAILRLLKPESIAYRQAILVALLGLLVNLLSALLLGGHHQHDHVRRASYLHVLADSFTSVLALVALTVGMKTGWWFLDPLAGVVGFFVIAMWSYDLIKETAFVLLDREMDNPLVQEVIKRIEDDQHSKVRDIHLLRLYHDRFACIVSIDTYVQKDVDYYAQKLADIEEIAHTTFEIRVCSREVFPESVL
ncbi:cation diffusion facilitator family transporter [Thermocrinis albus DSM 14484]|uniref:Cation diffusion facilitator family transporter n=1 Tax=Thermocrinis albus (strain DSM 14484 / JCM 11386 / HI 11/12) TaxID=638303 RepID=D3SNS7_THEAH|nr:cation diffusion facilitator family transporter [Thermocrinis albus]ADC88814.1 cation diffusion facilitator family transporter [Thermocrinis albus DSM 14484]